MSLPPDQDPVVPAQQLQLAVVLGKIGKTDDHVDLEAGADIGRVHGEVAVVGVRGKPQVFRYRRQEGAKTTDQESHVAASLYGFEDHVVGLIHPEDKVPATVVIDTSTHGPVAEIIQR